MHTCRALAFAQRDKRASVYSIFLPRYPQQLIRGDSSQTGSPGSQPPRHCLSSHYLPLDAQRPPPSGRLVPPPSTENILIQNYPSSQPPPSRACILAVSRSQPGRGLWVSRLLSMGGIFSALHLCILMFSKAG